MLLVRGAMAPLSWHRPLSRKRLCLLTKSFVIAKQTEFAPNLMICGSYGSMAVSALHTNELFREFAKRTAPMVPARLQRRDQLRSASKQKASRNRCKESLCLPEPESKDAISFGGSDGCKGATQNICVTSSKLVRGRTLKKKSPHSHHGSSPLLRESERWYQPTRQLSRPRLSKHT